MIIVERGLVMMGMQMCGRMCVHTVRAAFTSRAQRYALNGVL